MYKRVAINDLFIKIENDTMWATFAGLAVLHKNMIVMEIAYAALEDDEKVSLINEIKDKTDKETRQAMQVVLTGKLADADVLLERSGLSFRSLMLNIQMFKWKRQFIIRCFFFNLNTFRALELGLKNKQWLEIVMGYREKYLKNCGQKETDPLFLKHMSEVNQLVKDKTSKTFLKISIYNTYYFQIHFILNMNSLFFRSKSTGCIYES